MDWRQWYNDQEAAEQAAFDERAAAFDQALLARDLASLERMVKADSSGLLYSYWLSGGRRGDRRELAAARYWVATESDGLFTLWLKAASPAVRLIGWNPGPGAKYEADVRTTVSVPAEAGTFVRVGASSAPEPGSKPVVLEETIIEGAPRRENWLGSMAVLGLATVAFAMLWKRRK